MARRKAIPCARDLMEPVCVIVGARESVGEAARRLRAHQASAAPVVSSGRPIGLITRALAENALRYGLGQARARELICGGAPRARSTAPLPTLDRASSGTAPGLVVGHSRGAILGVLTRHRVEEAIQRMSHSGPPPGWQASRDLGAKMDSLLGDEVAGVLKRAGALAGVQGVTLCLVGGVVRDLLLGRASKDLDLVVEADGVAFAEELGRVLGARVTRHETFGTAAVHLPAGGHVDVATARRESYDHPAALPRVAPGSMLDDFSRRDVTINSMAIALDGGRYGRLLDKLDGQKDLRTGRLRVHHMLSITEDPTRAFRIARFAGRFDFEPAQETLRSLDLAIRARAFGMLTGERLYREFGLIAQEASPSKALAACARLGLLEQINPALAWDARASEATRRLFERFSNGLFDSVDGMPDRSLLMLMLLSLDARQAQRAALAERLRISGEAAERLRCFASPLSQLLRFLPGASKPGRIVRICEEVPPEVLALAWAAGPRSARRAVEIYLRVHRSVQPSLTGETLKSMGLPAGPAYRDVLARLRRARLDARVRDDDSERRLAEELVRRRLKD